MRALAVVLLVVGLLAGLGPAAAAPPLPAVPAATAGTQCVEDPATMRRQHMDFLRHQRDQTVHGGIRGARHSLKDCVACHATTPTGSVSAGPGDFCVACHTYTAVKIDCFECHTGQPPALALRQPGSQP
jgi:hypothetical protein